MNLSKNSWEGGKRCRNQRAAASGRRYCQHSLVTGSKPRKLWVEGMPRKGKHDFPFLPEHFWIFFPSHLSGLLDPSQPFLQVCLTISCCLRMLPASIRVLLSFVCYFAFSGLTPYLFQSMPPVSYMIPLVPHLL